MLAVFHIALPFNLVVPTTEAEFRLYPAEVDGYEVTVDVPRRSGRPLSPESPDYIEAAYLANVLTIRFRRLTFDRRVDANIDPPANTINSVLGSFLERLKFVTQAPQVHPIVFPQCNYRLRYLADDGTELQEENGLVRGRGSEQFRFSYVPCDPAVWDSIHSLPHRYAVPPWHTLLVDSYGALPHVGTAVVLAATALEVFISDALRRLD